MFIFCILFCDFFPRSLSPHLISLFPKKSVLNQLISVTSVEDDIRRTNRWFILLSCSALKQLNRRHYEPEAQTSNLHSVIVEFFYRIHRIFTQVAAGLDSYRQEPRRVWNSAVVRGRNYPQRNWFVILFVCFDSDCFSKVFIFIH